MADALEVGPDEAKSTLPVENLMGDAEDPFENASSPVQEAMKETKTEILDLPDEEKKNDRSRPERNQPQRKIAIPRSEERRGSFSKYHVYVVECDPKPKGVVTVARRYSDFLWLRAQLGKAFSALWIPPLPPKKMFNRFDVDFVESRRKDLERFLNRVEEIPALAESKQMTMFLTRPETTFKGGCQEIDEAMKDETNATRTYLFQTLFPDLHEGNLAATASIDLDRLREFLMKCQEQLEALLDACRTSLTKYDACSEEVKALSNVFTDLIQTETNYPYRPAPDRYDIRSQLSKWEAFTRQQTDLFEMKFLHTVQYEYQDVVAFLELMERRNVLENIYNKINARCETWRSTGDANLNDKAKLSKEADLKEEVELQGYLEIFNKIILQNEITKVWDEKIFTFEKNMLDFTEVQLGQTSQMAEIWSSVDIPT